MYKQDLHVQAQSPWCLIASNRLSMPAYTCRGLPWVGCSDATTAIVSAVCWPAAVLAAKVFADALWPYRWVAAALPCVVVGFLSCVALAVQCTCPILCGSRATIFSRADLHRALRAYACAAVITGFLDAATALLSLASLASIPAHAVLIALAAPDAARALGSLASARAAADREGRRISASVLAAHAAAPGSVVLAFAVVVCAACIAGGGGSLTGASSPWGAGAARLHGGSGTATAWGGPGACQTMLRLDWDSHGVGGGGLGAQPSFATAPCTAAQTGALATAAAMLVGAVVAALDLVFLRFAGLIVEHRRAAEYAIEHGA